MSELKTIHITKLYEKAAEEAALLAMASRTNMSESRIERAQKKYAEFIANKSNDTECFFLFGKTFKEKNKLKAAGWSYNSNHQAWWSRCDLKDFGFTKISA